MTATSVMRLAANLATVVFSHVAVAQPASGSQTNMPPPTVRQDEVPRPGPHSDATSRSFECMVEPQQMIEIRSPVEGLIASVPVRRGDIVRKGQIIVQLEDRPERAALEIARSRAAQRGPIESAAARVALAQRKLTRSKDLFAKDFVSLNATEEATTELDLATAQQREARESQKIAELEVTRAVEQLNLRTIRSPLNGVVVERFLWPGEFATTNVKQPIMKLAMINPLNVEMVLPVANFGIAKVGTRARVVLEAPVGGEYVASVTVVDTVIHGGSGTFGVRLELPNPSLKIPAGAKCRAHFL